MISERSDSVNPGRRVNQLKAGAVLSYVSMALGFVITLAYTPIVLRLLGQSEYGLYSLVSSVIGYLGLLSFGFGSAYVRFFSRFRATGDDAGVARLNGMFLIVMTAIGGIALAAGAALTLNADVVLGDQLTPEEHSIAKVLMAVMAVSMALTLSGSVFDSYVMANERFVFQKFMQLLRTIVSPFVVVPLLLMGYGSIGMVVATAAIGLGVQAYTAVFCVKTLRMQFAFRGLGLLLFMEVATFSFYIFANIVVDQISWSVDKYIVGWFRGAEAVAVFGIAALINTYYMALSAGVSGVLVPRVNRIVAREEREGELTELFTRVGRIQFILMAGICTGMVLFGRPFISLWAGADYVGAYPIALILMIPVTLPLIQNIGIEIQRAKNLHKFRSWVYLAVAIGNVLVSIPLARLYGGLGAAAGTAASVLLGNGILMNWYYSRRVGLDIRRFWSQILRLIPALVPAILVGAGLRELTDQYQVLGLAVDLAVYICVYTCSMWFLGMNQDERELVGRPVKTAYVKVLLHGRRPGDAAAR